MLFFGKNTKDIGKRGEDLATNFLSKKGYKIITRNFSVKGGEIDIIAQKSDMLIFVEVKTRKNACYGTAGMAVNYVKQQKIMRTALIFLSSHPHHGACRFDVIEVYLTGEHEKIHHLENAFEFSGI